MSIVIVPFVMVIFLSACGGGDGPGDPGTPIGQGQLNCTTSDEPLHGCWTSACLKPPGVTEERYTQYIMNFDTQGNLKLGLRIFTNPACSGNNYARSVLNDQIYIVGTTHIDGATFVEKDLDTNIPITGSVFTYTRYGIESDNKLCFPLDEFSWNGLGGFAPLTTFEAARPNSIDYTDTNCLSRISG